MSLDVIDLTHDEDAPVAPVREQQLLREIAILRRQLQHQQQVAVASPPVRSPSAFQSALNDFLANPRTSAAEVDRFLHQFRPMNDIAGMARSHYETLLEDVRVDTLDTVVGKLHTLVRHRIPCPREVWRFQRRVESIAWLVAAIGGDGAGRLLSAVHEAAGRPDCRDLYAKLDGADLLQVAVEMARPLGLSPAQQRRLTVVHYARHGPTQRLVEAIAAVREEGRQQTTHNHFPLLFQPLLEMSSQWLARLRVLVEAGAPGDAICGPWNATALHMLCYTKTGSSSSKRVPEAQLLEAARLLLDHGAERVLHRVDMGGGTSQRTALLQAASDGRLRLCELLLTAGADATLTDSHDQTMLELLFYLKHRSSSRVDYTCLDLYALANRFRLALSDELRSDCRGCGRCRYLLASVPEVDEEQEQESEEESSEDDLSDNDTIVHERATSSSTPMALGARMRLVQQQMQRLRLV